MPRPHPLNLIRNDDGATTLEWTLLLAGLGLPAYGLFNMALNTLVAYYQMMTTLNGLPFP